MIRQLLPHYFTADDDLREVGHAHNDVLGPQINCLVWNIFKARRTRWADDFSSLIADRNLVMLQESILNAPSDGLFEQQDGMRWVMARSFRHKASAIEHGIKTGCVAPAVSQHYYLSPHSEPFSQTRKLLLTTEYSLANRVQRLLVLNMHAINFVGADKYAQQLEQVSAAMQPHQGPIILAGDFNTWSDRRLEHFLEVAAHAGLMEAAMTRESRLTHLNRHLDHIFYRGLTLCSVESLGQYRSSDHAPIVATFDVPEND